jgi:hypothetical protein
MEILRIFILFVIVLNIGVIANMGIHLWQSTPLKEEKSTPIYITKEIKEN